MLNVVTGVFVNEATGVAQQERDLAIEEQLRTNDEAMLQFRRMFHEADEDESQALTWNEFKEHLEDERVKAYFRTLELQVDEAQCLFRLLDQDGDQTVSVDEFITGCLKYKGIARSLDVAAVRFDQRRTHGMLQRIDNR